MTQSFETTWTTEIDGQPVVIVAKQGPAPRKNWKEVPGMDTVDYCVMAEAPEAEESQCFLGGLLGVLLLALLMTAAVMMASAAVRCPA
jgi:hypothetical protein